MMIDRIQKTQVRMVFSVPVGWLIGQSFGS